jgi:hypothetical protein
VAAASTSNMLPLCKTRGATSRRFFFPVSIGVELGNLILILLNPALFAYFNSIEINIYIVIAAAIHKKTP